MDTAIVGGILSVLGVLGFFGGIALLMWVEQRGKAVQQRQQHEQRLRALELGRELPDAAIARAEAASSQTWAAAMVGFLVPLFALGAGAGGTALVLTLADESIHLAVLCTIWGVCGLICIVAVATSLGVVQRQPADPSTAEQAPSASKMTEPRLEARDLHLDMAVHER